MCKRVGVVWNMNPANSERLHFKYESPLKQQ